MEPPGLKFGLSRDLLQLSHESVIVSDVVLEAISQTARGRVVTGPVSLGHDFSNHVIFDGMRHLLSEISYNVFGAWLMFTIFLTNAREGSFVKPAGRNAP
jgi:hypothetical protein